MHTTAMICALISLFTLSSGGAPQDRPEPKPKIPEKGDTIVVKGCLSGSMLQDSESGRTYRLKGEKGLMKVLTKEHKGHMDEVTGELKSSLLTGSTRSKQVGKTKISIGVADTRNTGVADEYNPVLQVKSFNHLPGECAK